MSGADSSEREFTMTLDADGILHLVWTRGVAINASLARQAMTAVDELCGESPHLILVDLSSIGSADRPARAVFAEPSAPGRMAMFGASQVDRLIASFMLGLRKPPHPVKFFTDQAAAIAWLKMDLGRG